MCLSGITSIASKKAAGDFFVHAAVFWRYCAHCIPSAAPSANGVVNHSARVYTPGMNINLATAVPEGAIPVLAIKEKSLPESHPFFRVFSKENKAFLKKILVQSPLKAGMARTVFLIDGKPVILLGTVEKKKYTRRKAILVARSAVVFAKKEKLARLAIALSDFTSGSDASARECIQVITTQCEIANFEFNQYKTPPSEGWSFIDTLTFVVPKEDKRLNEAVHSGKVIGEEINHARTLSNTPGGDMTPRHLAEAAQKAGQTAGVRVVSLGTEEMKQLGMEGILGVAQGSSEKPQFIVLEYFHGKKSEKPVVLIGKGVTFDTGGLNLKPESAIYEMHMDMSGGAAVIHAITALARLKIKKNIVGLIPAVENMPSGSSYRPGDQLKTLSGKTIEVINTDAEGRIILADALTYAKRYQPSLVVDIATLTGASMIALGQRAIASFSNDFRIGKKLIELGEQTGDLIWPLPLWEEYEEDIRGKFGDFANSSKVRYGGAITAAVFLWQFVKETAHGPEYAWVHLDIAPRMTSIDSDMLAPGAAGAGIALLVSFLER